MSKLWAPRTHDTASNERSLALLTDATARRYPHAASLDLSRGGQDHANVCGHNYSAVILRSRIFCFETARARDRFVARTGARETTLDFWKRRLGNGG